MALVDGFRGITLDLGGVLFVSNEDDVRAALATVDVFPDAATLRRAFYAGMAALDELPDGQTWDREVFLRAYATACGVPTQQLPAACQELAAPRGGPGTLVTEAREALAGLAEAGLRLAVVTNFDGTAEKLLGDYQLCQVGPGPGVELAAVIDSAVVGVSKPDPEIFDLALQALELPASQVLHVGDSLTSDVRGAQAAGITGVHLDPLGLCCRSGHLDVHSLAELVA